MPNLIWRFREFISSASPQRTLTILGSLLLLAAIPLTTYVAQQQQDIRQRASGSCSSCDTTYESCSTAAQNQKNAALDALEATYAICRENCNTDAACNGCVTTRSFGTDGVESTYRNALLGCENNLTACRYTCSEPTATSTPTGCRCMADNTWGPDPGTCTSSLYGQSCIFACSGTELVDSVRTEYDCQLAEGSQGYGCQSGWFPSSRTPNACTNQGTYCCYKEVTGNGTPPSPTAISGGQPTTPVSSSAPQATQPPRSGGGGSCTDNPAIPPANHKWVANCSGNACTQNSDCPRSTDTAFVDPATSNWCYGFGSVPADARCLKLEYTGSRIGATPIPTVPPDQATNCNPALLTMSLSPASPAIGASVTFNSAGTQGSTFIGDTWSGGVNCTGNFWGNKACSATTAGTFTWTHNWKNCAPNNCSITSTQCTKTLSFTIGTATSPTATATSIPGATNTPTATGVVASPTTPVAPGDVIFNFTLNLNAITTGRSLSTPQRNLAVELFNANGDKIVEKTGTNILAYNASSGKFSGAVNMGQVAVGNYTVKVKSNRYLRKRVPGIVTVPANTQQITIPETTLIVGDMNNDNIVNITDYNMLLSCFGEKSTSASCGGNKRNADLDDNNWVDEVDFNIYVRSLAIQSGD